MKSIDRIPTSKLQRASKIVSTGAKVGVNYIKYYGERLRKSEEIAKYNLNKNNADDIYGGLKQLKGSALKVAQMLSMEKNILPKNKAIIIFLVFAFGYFLSCLLRAVTATLSPVLSSEFNLNAGDLGLLAGGYFLGFATMQIPLGYLLDNYGPKKIVSAFLLIAIIGTLSFAAAQNFSGLLVSRVLIGIGVSACLMGPLTGYRIWFKDKYQQRSNSWMLMVASLGFVFSTLPVQILLPFFGWRYIFFTIAGLIVICIFLLFIFLPNWENQNSKKIINKSGNLSEVWNNKFFQSTIPLGLFNYGGIMAIQTLWAGPWMVRVTGYTPLESATGLFWINVTMLIAFLIWGYLLPKISSSVKDAVKLIKLGLPISYIILFILFT